MRRHAKASSAGSTQGQGSRSGSFVRGADAPRGSSSDADGSGAPSRRGLATLSLAAALLALALFASSAFASKEVISDFGTLAGSGALGGELNTPRDVAVNETGVGPANAGDTYVADEANNRIERFDSAGNFISAWGKDVSSAAGTDFETCTVAAECQAGVASGENGALNQPQSVAVDQDTGNVYVSDRGNRRIDEYDGEGNFIRSFGFDVAESGPGDTGTGYEVCNEAESDVCKAGEAGSGVGQYGEGFAERGFGIAVSPADANASTGTVYLADSGNRRVGTYDLDGADPASFGSATNFGEEQPRSIAVDSRGIVYASDSNDNGNVQRYDSQDANGGGVGFLAPIVAPNDERQEIAFAGFSTGDNFKLTCPNGTPTEELTYVGGETGTKIIKSGLEEACGAANVSLSGEPPNVTVTFGGALAAANQPQMTCTTLGGAGSCSVATTSEGNPGPLLSAESGFSATIGLAVNPAGTVLYVLRVPSSGPIVVQQLGPANEPGLSAPPSAADDTHGAAAGLGSDFSSYYVRGFGFDSASGRLFVSAIGDPDGSERPLTWAHRVYVLNDASSLPAPTASLPSVGAVTDTDTRSATLHGEVDPKGGLVSCKFQYSTDEATWTDVSVPSCAALSQNGGVQDVSQDVSGLAPDTDYFVRLQVTRTYFSGFTPVISAAQSFATASGPPVLSEAKARAVDERSVRVSATIDPSNSPTTYVIQYGTSPALGSSTAPVSVGAGTQPIEVSPVIGGLSPATQYYFKVVATNLVDSTASDDLPAATFAAPPSFGSCPNDRFRTGPSAKLPDCRAYEQATPTDKFGTDAFGSTYSVQASPAGDGVTSYTFGGFPASEGFQYANVFLSRFAGGEWSTAGLNTPPSYGDEAFVLAVTPDLRLSFAKAKDFEAGEQDFNLVMRDSADGSRTLLIPQGVGFVNLTLGGAFDDHSKVVFEADGAVPVTSGPAPISTAGEAGNVYLYDRDSGELTLAGLLPDSACASPPCVPAEGSRLPAAFGTYVQDGHVVSPSGDVYFTDRGTDQPYLRRGAAAPAATTELVSASHKTDGPGLGGVAANSPQPATFHGATPDGSLAFFTSSEELTNDANTGPVPPAGIGRANGDGSGAQPSFIPTTAKWTAVDAGHVYWTNTAAGTIGRAEIDGANPDPSFITGLENPEGIAVDSGHLYWAEARDRAEGHGTIARATLAGGSIEEEFITGAGDPHGVAVSSAYVYWTNGANTDIGRATITGGSPEQSFLARASGEHPWGIAVNATNLYWVEDEGGASAFLIKVNVGGGGESYREIGDEARGIAIDSNYVYWSEVNDGRIGRRPLDFGIGTKEIIIASIKDIYGLAADAGHIYWAAGPAKGGPPQSPGNDLYRYDAASGELIDLAPDSTDPNGAEVVGMLGYSNDGSHAYFAANGDLDGAGPAASGDCAGTASGIDTKEKFSGSCSVYLWRDEGAGACAAAGGCVSFVTPLKAAFVVVEGLSVVSDGYNWESGGSGEVMKTSRVSADGRTLVFRSRLKLTSYDNTPPDGACGREESPPNDPVPCQEFYRYDAGSGQISCLTCNPTGAPPTGTPDLKNPDLYHAPSSNIRFGLEPFLSRNLSADGNRFFFQSTDKLVPADVNGEVKCDEKEIAQLGAGPSCRDVYQWEAPGTPGGSCTTNSGAYSPANGGCIYLLSTGTGAYPSYLADVSESGDTAFVFSRQQLVPSDEDTLQDIYAVKAGGGLAAQHAARPAACEGDGCRGASSQAPSTPGAGSAAFEGPGNPKQGTNKTRCPKGKRTVHAKGKVRCVAKHKKKHKGKAHKRAANNERRASR